MTHVFRRINTVLISMVLGATYTFVEGSSPWNGSTKMPDFNGETYTIRTAEELAWIASASRTNDFAGKKIVLTDDIDLGGTASTPPSWEPIGSAEKPFRGELDGANHVIYNLYMLSSLFPTGAGLIAESGSQAVVHHVGIAQGQIMTDATSNVGCVAGTNRGQIHHCFNMAQIIAHNGDNVGGLVGTNYGRIAYSYNAGIITDGNNHVGGLVGYNHASAVLDNCYNIGYCKGSDHVGALFGKNEAPEENLTMVYFDQQLTRMYATGYGAADPIITDNTVYAKQKSTDLIGNASPYYENPESEWRCTSGGYDSHPQLVCFAGHIASESSVKAILLDAEKVPIMRAEGVGAPEEGNKPRNSFGLERMNSSEYGAGEWSSPSPDVILIPNPKGSTATVKRPCGNQEVILTMSCGPAVKQVYTIVKGYEAFDAGIVSDAVSVCWNELDVRFKDKNKGGKEASGGKDDEQDKGSVSYQYMIIRDTITGYDENGFPNTFEPIDTFYMSQPEYNKWAMPTDVPGAYAFRRYVHDTKCKTEWTASKGSVGQSEGRLYLYVRLRVDPGDLYEEPDTIYGLPQVLTIQSKTDASGGGGEFEYVWKMEHAVLDTAEQTWTMVEDDTREPLYIGSTKVSTPSFEYLFTQPGEYTFYRKVSEATCQALPLECEHAHKVVVFNAINPGKIESFERALCTPVCTDTIRETGIVSGGNGIYSYRWVCNGVAIPESDTTDFEIGNFPMINGESYVFRREVKDNTGLMDWTAAEGEVSIHVYSAYNAGFIGEKDEQVCLESGTIQEVEMHIDNKESASGEGDFSYCWLLYRGGSEEKLLDTLRCNTAYLDTTVTLSHYGLTVPVTLYVKRAVQNSLCQTEWQVSGNTATWRLGRKEKKDTAISVCMADMPYQGRYTCSDGHTESYLFEKPDETKIIMDKTPEGCPMEVTLVCKVTPVPVVDLKPIVSLCQSDATLKIDYTVREGAPDRYDLVFTEQSEELGFVSVFEGELPLNAPVEVPVPDSIPVATCGFDIIFYAATAGDSDCKGIVLTRQLSIDLDGYVHRKGNDVVFVDNSGKNNDNGLTFTAYQWYRNDEPIEGATEQFYYEYLGLNGYYQVEMTGSDGTVYRSCQYEMRPMQGLEEVEETVDWSDAAEVYTLDGRRCRAMERKGVYIIVQPNKNSSRKTFKLLIP